MRWVLAVLILLLAGCQGVQPLSDEVATVTLPATPTYTPTFTPSATQTLTPSLTFTPSQTLTPSRTSTPSITPTPSLTMTPTETPTPTASDTPTLTPTFTASPTPSATYDLQVPVISLLEQIEVYVHYFAEQSGKDYEFLTLRIAREPVDGIVLIAEFRDLPPNPENAARRDVIWWVLEGAAGAFAGRAYLDRVRVKFLEDEPVYVVDYAFPAVLAWYDDRSLAGALYDQGRVTLGGADVDTVAEMPLSNFLPGDDVWPSAWELGAISRMPLEDEGALVHIRAELVNGARPAEGQINIWLYAAEPPENLDRAYAAHHAALDEKMTAYAGLPGFGQLSSGWREVEMVQDGTNYHFILLVRSCHALIELELKGLGLDLASGLIGDLIGPMLAHLDFYLCY